MCSPVEACRSPWGEYCPHDRIAALYMNSLRARLGHFDSRRAVQSIWNTRKRKGPEWICTECRARRAVKQRRNYSDDAIRLDNTSYFFPRNTDYRDEVERRLEHEPSSRSKETIEGEVGADDATERSSTSPSFFTQHQAGNNGAAEDLDLWENFEAADPDVKPREDMPRAFNGSEQYVDDQLPSIADDAMLDLDYKDALTTSLMRKEADVVVRCLYAANRANDLQWLQSIPATTFSDIIRLLEPNKFIAKLASAHVELSTAMVAQLGLAPMHQIAFEYIQVLRQVIAIRRSAGVGLTLDDYTILLRSARDLGNQRMGSTLFGNLLNEGHVPTTSCYNYYMSAVVWNGVHLAGSRHKVRTIPFNMLGRKQAKPDSRFRNYRVATGGVREVAMKIFNDMLAHGAVANEDSFRILLTASAREGDIAVVKSMLKKIWNIDVEGILGSRDDTSFAPKALSEDSLLRPTPALLFTIAHAFGINNDIPAALRIVDFVARHYDLAITDQVWSQLFEWTFVLSVPRWGRDKANGSMTGQLPPESLLNLWDTMTGPPYNIRPSMGMYNYMIKNLFRRKWTPKLIEKIREGIVVYTDHRHAAYACMSRLEEETRRRDAGEEHGSIEQLRHEWEYADLVRRRDRFWVQRWLRLLLGSFRDWHARDHTQQLLCRELPRLLWEWSSLIPSIVRYETSTGFIEFASRTEEEIAHSARVKAVLNQRRQNLLHASKKYVGNNWINGQQQKRPRPQIERDERDST